MPSALLALLAVAVLVTVAWSVAILPLQQPDEPNHMARIQRIAEGGQLKTPVTRDWSTDQTIGAGAVNALGLPGYPTIKPSWDPAADRAYRDTADGLEAQQRRDADAPTTADSNPPAYYWWGAAWYTLGSDFLARTWVIRLSGALLFAITIAGTWLLVGELFGRRRLFQVAGAGFVALQPMAGSLSSAVTPDSLLIAASTVTLWLLVRTLRREPSPANIAGLLVAFVVAVAAKSVAFALLPAVLLAIVVALSRTPRGRRIASRSRTPRGAVIAAISATGLLGAVYLALRFAAPSVAPVLTGTLTGLPAPRRFASYLWQFYLGPADFLEPTPNLGPEARFRVTWIEQGWGRFGSLDSGLSDAWLNAIAWGGVVVILAALAALIAHRRRVDGLALCAIGVAVAATLLGLHLTEYNLLISFLSGPILQGRYLLPLVAVGGLVVAAAVAIVPRPARPAAVGVLLTTLFAVQISGLFDAATRFYAY